MNMKNVVLAALLGLIPAVAQSQTAAQNCGPRDVVIMALAERYGEGRQGIGLGGNQQVVEIFANLDTGTWTITVTLPTGIMCLVASGQSYESLSEEPKQGDPA
jgi:hypothetical protein